MDEQDMVPQSELEPTGAPQEFGFPLNPTAQQRKCWADQERFLRAYAECGRPYAACRAAGVTVHAYHAWGDKDLYSFKKRMERSEQEYVEKMEAEADRRAIEGIDHPVTWQGVITDTYKQFSDNLLMFRMKKLRPEYKDNYAPAPVATTNNTQIVINYPEGYVPQRKYSEIIEGEELPSEDK